MSFLYAILKILVASIVFVVTFVVFIVATASYLPRLSGANYYDHGCFDGVTNLVLEIGYDKAKRFEAAARDRCKRSVTKLRKDGYL